MRVDLLKLLFRKSVRRPSGLVAPLCRQICRMRCAVALSMPCTHVKMRACGVWQVVGDNGRGRKAARNGGRPPDSPSSSGCSPVLERASAWSATMWRAHPCPPPARWQPPTTSRDAAAEPPSVRAVLHCARAGSTACRRLRRPAWCSIACTLPEARSISSCAALCCALRGHRHFYVCHGL